MGICSSSNSYKEEAKNINNYKTQEIIANNPLNKINIELYNVIKSVCKIITNIGSGTGFLIKLYKNKNEFFCLMTNEHMLKKEMIKSNEKITIFYDAQNERKETILNPNLRYIKEYRNINLDITIIEILKEDDINKKYFLLPYIGEYNLINRNIYIVQFPEDNLCESKGKIIKINNNEITYDVEANPGS